MNRRRVVITGMGSVSPYGHGNKFLKQGLDSASDPFSHVKIKVSKDRYGIFPVGLVPTKYYGYDDIISMSDLHIPREIDRSMSNLSRYAYFATREALMQSGITQQNDFYSNIGTAISSTLPSIHTYEELFNKYIDIDPKQMPSTISFKTMNHTSSLNIASAFGLKGRCLSPSSACAGGLQSIILGYEAIAFNRTNVMVCGGTEEYHPFLTLIFNKLGIASKSSCKPFDIERDGIIISEGSGILVLEEYEHAINRGANIIAEILGTGINTSSNLANSDIQSIYSCMQEAIKDANKQFHIDKIKFINAHATGTNIGDMAEGKAIESIFNLFTNVNSLKGYFGHAMGASGSLELIASILGLQDNKFYSTIGCNNYDKRCGNININNKSTYFNNPILLKNNFGLGGINTSVIIKIFNNN